jgi:hypothetical protein
MGRSTYDDGVLGAHERRGLFGTQRAVGDDAGCYGSLVSIEGNWVAGTEERELTCRSGGRESPGGEPGGLGELIIEG